MIVAVASRAGSPGVTTLASLVAWLWPATVSVNRVILEADSTGGVLAPRWHDAHGITLDPGLIDLAAAQARSGHDGVDPESVQWISPGFGVVPAPSSPDQISASLRALEDRGADRLATSEHPVIVDCGRVRPDDPAIALAARASVMVLMCRPSLDEVQRLAPLVAELRPRCARLGLVTVGDRPYDPVEISDHLGVHFLGVLADDRRWADSIRTDGFSSARLGRSELVRSARTITDRILQLAVEADTPSPSKA